MRFTLGRWQWFTRVVVVTDLDDPLTEEADMPVSPTSTRSCHSKGTPPPPAIRMPYGSPSPHHRLQVWNSPMSSRTRRA